MPKTKFLAQPDGRLGDLLFASIKRASPIKELVIVSAFVSLTTALRFKQVFANIKSLHGVARLVIGIDMGGTSKQVLSEIAEWGIDVRVVKNAVPAMTFHPKLYSMRWDDAALLVVGSNNLTDGGLFRNYEAASITEFKLPDEERNYARRLKELERFLSPVGDTVKVLDEAYLQSLLGLAEIPSEAEARVRRADAVELGRRTPRPPGVFGTEKVDAPPSLPVELQKLVVAARGKQVADFQRAKRKHKSASPTNIQADVDLPMPDPVMAEPLAVLDPTAFYINLPSMHADSPTIPGEMRIPFQAVGSAPDFFRLDRLTVAKESPRFGAHAKEVRSYREFYSRWRVWDADDPTNVHDQPVRMYIYENSSDFRQMISALNDLGGSKGDIIKITAGTNGADYDCSLARAGTKTFDAWAEHLVMDIRNSTRKFGFE